jgi:hypothetical protein
MRRTRFPVALLAPALLLTGSHALGANQIMACVIEGGLQNNPRYHHMPNTATRLRCEFSGNQRPNLRELYSNGWRLLDIEPVDQPAGGKQNFVSPILYLEREVPLATPGQAANQAKPQDEVKQQNQFLDSLFR